MNAHAARSSLRTVAASLIAAVGLVGLMGCDDPVTPYPGVVLEESPVWLENRVTLVEAGSHIRVIVRTPDVADGDAWFRTTVSWDPSSFEYLGCDPHRLEARFADDMNEGWMSVEDGTAPYLPKREITFLFRALVDANTAGFAVHMEDPSTATDDSPVDR